jgi:hypothetical protein
MDAAAPAGTSNALRRVPGMPLAFISPPIGVIFISFLVEGKAGGHHHSFSSWRRSASD